MLTILVVEDDCKLRQLFSRCLFRMAILLGRRKMER